MSFFTSCPLTLGISVPLNTLCTSNSSLSSRNFVRVHWCEAASRLVFVRAWLKKDIPMLIGLTKDISLLLTKAISSFQKAKMLLFQFLISSPVRLPFWRPLQYLAPLKNQDLNFLKFLSLPRHLSLLTSL
jgi:hypothetical protein